MNKIKKWSSVIDYMAKVHKNGEHGKDYVPDEFKNVEWPPKDWILISFLNFRCCDDYKKTNND